MEKIRHRANFQIRAIRQLPALVGIAGRKRLCLLSSSSFVGDKDEPGEPVAVGVEFALALAAGQVLLVGLGDNDKH